ncbi:hypothetical protein lerEdw1_002183 [Lerista edwardsae]|nr:hypothetical protein lerEdw1_002183 [Lerista edwardsae]
MESSSNLAALEEEPFTEARCFIANYVADLGQLSSARCGPAHHTDSLDLLGGPGDLGDIFCWSDNLDHCIAYLNKELVTLGLPALYKEGGYGDGPEHGFDLLALVNGASQLLELYRGAIAKLSDMETEETRRAGELDYLRARQGKLKDQVEACEREIAAVQNKEQQLQSKNKQLNNMLKGEKDEITKLQSALASQRSQHVHDMKKKEHELVRLKEKMSQLVTDKKDKKGASLAIDYLNALSRTDGKRGTLKTGKSLSKKEEELYRTQLAKQEQREQGLMLENAKLKQLLNQVSQNVQQLLGLDVSIAQGIEQSSAYEVFQEQWNSLWNSMKIVAGQAVDCDGSQMPRGDGSDPVISVTDHDKEIMKLKEEIEESKILIALQKQCFQEQLAAAASSEFPSHLKGSYFLEEQQQLQEEREMFKEQKQAFELERKNFTEAAIRLGRERKQFEEEKALFLKQEFLCTLPSLGMEDPGRRLSTPVAVREHDHSPRLKRWGKPVCTPYSKLIINPSSREFFRRWQLASSPSGPMRLYRQQTLPENWPISSPQFSRSKANHQDTACQTETPVKNFLQSDLLDHFRHSFF